MWRHVTTVALLRDDNKINDGGDGKENGKNKMFILTSNNFARESRWFVHFFAIIAPLRDEISLFNSPLYVVGEDNTKIVAFFF